MANTLTIEFEIPDDQEEAATIGIKAGYIIKTNYNTGIYTVHSVTGPCTCLSYLESINNVANPKDSEPHFHIVCKDKSGLSYLNGYRDVGERVLSVWGDVAGKEDELFIIDKSNGLLF